MSYRGDTPPEAEHRCSLTTGANPTYETIHSLSVSGTVSADAIVKLTGTWFMIVGIYEYAMPINVCPFCGERL